jgi:site-specific recombinase XerD
MKRSTFKILFYLNTSKRKKSGLCPVMVRITVDGGVAQFSLKEDAHPDKWDTKKGRVRGNNRENIELNRKIEQTEQTIKNIYTRTVDRDGYVTAEQIKNEFSGVTGKAEMLLELFVEHNMEFEKRIGIDREYGTYEMYKCSYKHLSRFIRSKYRQEDYALQQLDMSFINDFNCYLHVDARLKPNSTLSHIIILRKLVKRAIHQGTIPCDPFAEYVPNQQDRKYLHISGEELDKIMSARIASKSVGFVRDMFVFSCFTGLAYADMRQLSEKHLRKAADGSIWIDIQRLKTGVESNIRLLNIPLSIIEKYRPVRKSDCLFDMINPTSIGRNLRIIEKLCGIPHLHFHMARHTFATLLCMTNGVPMETVSKMMGHSSMHTTQIYAEITGQKVREDMTKLAARTKGKYTMN